MTIWAWVAGLVMSVAGAWLGAGPLDSNWAAAGIGIGVPAVWKCCYWIFLDRTEAPDLTLERSLPLGAASLPGCVALAFAVGIDDGRKFWFCLSSFVAVQLLGPPTTRLRVDDPGRDWD